MAEQALQNSVDVEEIKKFRQIARTQVTNSVGRLGNFLDKKDGNFLITKPSVRLRLSSWKQSLLGITLICS